jgi:hypothetical protein
MLTESLFMMKHFPEARQIKNMLTNTWKDGCESEQDLKLILNDYSDNRCVKYVMTDSVKITQQHTNNLFPIVNQ